MLSPQRKRPDPAINKIFGTRGLAGRVAEHLGITYQAVQQWEVVPPQHVLIVSPLIGMTPEQIRPDVFDPKKGRWVFKK